MCVGVSVCGVCGVCVALLDAIEVTCLLQDLNQHTCIVCPWHRYTISLQTGEGFYRDMQGQWKCKGKRQRTHRVRVRKGQLEVRHGISLWLESLCA